MSKRKTAIGDLIKSDMSRRSISEGIDGEMPISETQNDQAPNSAAINANPVPDEVPGNISAGEKQTAARAAPSLFTEHEALPEGSAGFAAFLSREARSAGITDKEDMRKFHDFLQSQAARYIRGYNAGRRFYG